MSKILGSRTFKHSINLTSSLKDAKTSSTIVAMMSKSDLEADTQCGFTKWIQSTKHTNPLFWEDFKKSKSGWLFNDKSRVFLMEHEKKEDEKTEVT